DPPAARPILVELGNEPEMREFVIRAAGDRDAYLEGVDPKWLVAALKDSSARVRAQAAIALGHLGKAAGAKELVGLTWDEDVMVRQAAMQALRRMNAADACLAALGPGQRNELVSGALRTLRGMYDAKVVAAVGAFVVRQPDAKLRQEAIR